MEFEFDGCGMQVVEYDGRLELIPVREISELRGFVRGIDTNFEREKDTVLWTQNSDFEGFPNVKYFSKS